MDSIHTNKKNNMAGQMSLFDIVDEEDKESFDVKLPDVGEYTKEMLLAFEKEVLGVYISGHPLEEYTSLWNKNITAKTSDFILDEETGICKLEEKDGQSVIIGGMISEKKIKYTKNDKIMAFLTVEDLVGSVEVIVFPKDYERNSVKLSEDSKVFIKGRVSIEEERDGKLILESITAFEDMPKTLWIKFASMEEYADKEKILLEAIHDSDGRDSVGIFLAGTKQMKKLPPNLSVQANPELIHKLEELFGKDNINLM
jgi:DNA polymerase-3 subunit alpha